MEEDVRGSNPAEWGLLVAVVSLRVGIGALAYARRAARVSEEELALAKDQATFRPKLVVVVRELERRLLRHNPGNRPESIRLAFDVKNEGWSAAHNVRCKIALVDPGLPSGSEWSPDIETTVDYLGPQSHRSTRIDLALPTRFPVDIRWSCVYDEVGESEGSLKFDPSKFEQVGPWPPPDAGG